MPSMDSTFPAGPIHVTSPTIHRTPLTPCKRVVSRSGATRTIGPRGVGYHAPMANDPGFHRAVELDDDYYRQQARACYAAARMAFSPAHRATFLRMARHWRMAAAASGRNGRAQPDVRQIETTAALA